MTETSESEFVRHVACPECDSSDAGSLYSDGHVYCFACTKTSWPDGTQPTTKRRTPMSTEFLTGESRAVTARGLSEATCRKYGYRIAEDRSGRACQVADYRDSDGTLVAQKVRYANKAFTILGEGAKLPLFGQNLWQAGGKRLVITEGEIDALSVAQAMNLSWPAVSLPNGAQAAKKAFQTNLEYIESFEEVVLMFDNDEHGRAAAAECAPLLSAGKARIAELPRKDANDMLKANEVKALVSAVYQARVYRPDGIVSLADVRERVLSTAMMGAPWPFEEWNKATFGRQPGDVIGLGAGTGIGKTDLFTQIIAHDVTTLGKRCGVLYLEQGVGETGRRVAGKTVGRPFHVPDGSWTQDQLVAAWEALEASGKLHLYDSFGAMSWEVIKPKILYMLNALDCEHIFLDHLTALAAAADDERTALEKIMAEIAGIAKASGCVFHYVSHLATPEGKSHEEGGRVSTRHFKGSRAIGFWSHQLYGLERNQQADSAEERSKTYLRCLKDRLTGRGVGKVFELQYDPKSGLMAEVGEFVKESPNDDGNTDF